MTQSARIIPTPAHGLGFAALSRQSAPAWDLPACCGLSIFRALLQLVFAVFSVAFRRDTAVPLPEAPLAPESLPDIASLQALSVNLHELISASSASCASASSLSSSVSMAAMRFEASAWHSAITRDSGLVPFRAIHAARLLRSCMPDSFGNPISSICHALASSALLSRMLHAHDPPDKRH